jgi:hypothetical protein
MPRIHIIRWRDAHQEGAEGGREDVLRIHRPAIYWTVGVLVLSNEQGVTVAQDYGLPFTEGGEPTFRTRTFIPRELIEAEFDAGSVIRKGIRKPSRPSETNL